MTSGVDAFGPSLWLGKLTNKPNACDWLRSGLCEARLGSWAIAETALEYDAPRWPWIASSFGSQVEGRFGDDSAHVVCARLMGWLTTAESSGLGLLPACKQST